MAGPPDGCGLHVSGSIGHPSATAELQTHHTRVQPQVQLQQPTTPQEPQSRAALPRPDQEGFLESFHRGAPACAEPGRNREVEVGLCRDSGASGDALRRTGLEQLLRSMRAPQVVG
jgi:hypothetical protein